MTHKRNYDPFFTGPGSASSAGSLVAGADLNWRTTEWELGTTKIGLHGDLEAPKSTEEGVTIDPPLETVLPPPTERAAPIPHCQYHCAKCERHFTSLQAFDEHILVNTDKHGTTHVPPGESPRLIQIIGACKLQGEPGHSGPLPEVIVWTYQTVPEYRKPTYPPEEET